MTRRPVDAPGDALGAILARAVNERALATARMPSASAPAGARLQRATAGKKNWWRSLSTADLNDMADHLDALECDSPGVEAEFADLMGALAIQRRATTGRVRDAYHTTSDSLSGYSVEITLPWLDNWVLHVHCNRDGSTASPKGRGSPAHYKRRRDVFDPRRSLGLTETQARWAIPAASVRLAYVKKHCKSLLS